jgi:hypothetical protein
MPAVTSKMKEIDKDDGKEKPCSEGTPTLAKPTTSYSLRGAEQLDGGRPLRGRGLVVAQWYMAYKPLQSRATIMATGYQRGYSVIPVGID